MESPSYTLPTTSCVRSNQHLLAVYCESKVAEELLSSKTAFIMPDGTSRQGVGEIAAVNAKIGDKI